MGQIDKIKERIGYLKVIFGLFVAIEVSMVGWLFRYGDEIGTLKIIIVAMAIVLVAVTIVIINKKILKNIDELEAL